MLEWFEDPKTQWDTSFGDLKSSNVMAVHLNSGTQGGFLILL